MDQLNEAAERPVDPWPASIDHADPIIITVVGWEGVNLSVEVGTGPLEVIPSHVGDSGDRCHSEDEAEYEADTKEREPERVTVGKAASTLNPEDGDMNRQQQHTECQPNEKQVDEEHLASSDEL